MKRIEAIQNTNLDEFALFLNSVSDDCEAVWIHWFDKKYCRRCKPIIKTDDDGLEKPFAPCECDDTECPFGVDINKISNLDIIKMWLNDEV